MKIVVPMTGVGQRFLDAGYKTPKPLLLVEGKPIIEYVINLFPGGADFVFICNNDHLNNTNMKNILLSVSPSAKIVAIESHKKGPVFATKFVYDLIPDNGEVIVSYCDFGGIWDYEEFLVNKKELAFDGAVPSYAGFHPHLLHKKLYGSLLVDKNDFATDYKEKHCFTENPMDCNQSAGIYYFKSGKQLKKYSNELLEENNNLDGEFYTSMVYYNLLKDKLKIYVPKMTFFCQWGTPEDLEEYEAWSRLIHKNLNLTKKKTDIPSHRKIKIPYEISSENYKRCYKYWSEYFKKVS